MAMITYMSIFIVQSSKKNACISECIQPFICHVSGDRKGNEKVALKESIKYVRILKENNKNVYMNYLIELHP